MPPEIAPHIWRFSKGLVVQRPGTSAALPTHFPLVRISGEAINTAPTDYWIVDANGRVTERFECQVWSIEDELGVSVFLVDAAELRKVVIRQFWDRPGVDTKIEEQVVADGLVEVAPDDAAARRQVSEAVGRHERAEHAAQESAESARKALVTAIEGATEAYPSGDNFQRAQEVLCSRLEDYGDDQYGDHLFSDLLRALVAFGRLHRSPIAQQGKSFSSALESFATACRLAAFDRSAVPTFTPTLEDGPGWQGRERAGLSALDETLSRLAITLRDHADGQEWVDANQTATQFRKAADRVDDARRALSSLLSENPSA